MNINLTLIVQMLVFVVLTLFTMKKIWPLILGVMDERAKKIALGLAAADKGQEQLKQAHQEAEVIIREARERAQKIIDQAQQRANEAIEQAKGTAAAEGQRLVAAAQQQISLESTACARNPAPRGGCACGAGGLQASRARNRSARACRSHGQARRADLDDRQDHHRQTLCACRVRRSAGARRACRLVRSAAYRRRGRRRSSRGLSPRQPARDFQALADLCVGVGGEARAANGRSSY